MTERCEWVLPSNFQPYHGQHYVERKDLFMVLPFLFVNWSGHWYAHGCCLKISTSAWRTNLCRPALQKICARVSFLIHYHGMNIADSFIKCLFITYYFCPYDVFVWWFGTLCGLARFSSAWKMLSLGYLCPLQTDCMDWVRYLLVCCFFPWVFVGVYEVICPSWGKAALKCKWKIRLHDP